MPQLLTIDHEKATPLLPMSDTPHTPHTPPSSPSSPLSAAVLAELAPAVDPLRSVLDGRTTALAQEWIGSRAGSEKVFEALAVLLPEARLCTLTHEPDVRIETSGRPIETSFLDRPALRDRRALTLPIMPFAWRRLRQPVDLAVTSAHAFARSFGLDATTHLSYVHSPARYVWFPDVDTRTGALAGAAQAPARAILKRVDLRSTRRTNSLAANSETTRSRIRAVYGRDAYVVHPPVDTTYYTPGESDRRDGLLALGRLIRYKQMDTAIEVARRLDQPLVIVGTGPDRERLERLAATSGAEVQFVGRVDDAEVRRLYRTSSALLFPGNEDFGIVPVEAMACGLPVVAAGVGGTTETVLDGVTGVHADRPDVDAMAAATERLLAAGVSPAACRRQAERFSYAEFGRGVVGWFERALAR